jgi:hypothetical protein
LERRTTEAVLASHARELAEWSKDVVLVASDIAVRPPRRHRFVRDKAAGEQAFWRAVESGFSWSYLNERFVGCRTPSECRLAGPLFGATCDRSPKTVFERIASP